MDHLNPKPGRKSPVRLQELLALGLAAHTDWSPQELEAVIVEQISLPMDFQLHGLDQPQAARIQGEAAARHLLLKNLRELLLHSHPPLPLLLLAKDFFKANCSQPSPGLPAEVARCLYYLVLAVARSRHQTRISSLTDAELLQGIAWLQQQSWIPRELKQLAETAKATFAGSPTAPTGSS